jgi:hypothetical protein
MCSERKSRWCGLLYVSGIAAIGFSLTSSISLRFLFSFNFWLLSLSDLPASPFEPVRPVCRIAFLATQSGQHIPVVWGGTLCRYRCRDARRFVRSADCTSLSHQRHSKLRVLQLQPLPFQPSRLQSASQSRDRAELDRSGAGHSDANERTGFSV